MSSRSVLLAGCLALGAAVAAAASAARQIQTRGYVLEHEKDLAEQQPGPHRGGGRTTAYSFFAKVPELELVFRKRVLHPGSAIGYHLQREDEVYYILEGRGVMRMNGDTFAVGPGDAILTRPGSSHGLEPAGDQDLTIFIVYRQPVRTQPTR